MAGSIGAQLAGFVRTHRLRAGLTQEDLAERSGLTVDTIGAIERGLRRRLYPHSARAIAGALGIAGPDLAAFTALAHPGGGAARGPRRDEAAGAHTTAGLAVGLGVGLPLPQSPLIGRERDLAQVCSLLDEARLVTLTGTGGIGKSRLALEAAHALRGAFPDGVRFIELAAFTEPGLVVAAVAAAAGVAAVPGEALFQTLASALESKRVLLILDNFEQVLGAAPAVTELLGRCPRVAVLATSRAPLRLTSERTLQLQPLLRPVPGAHHTVEAVGHYAAIRLFVERAQAVNPGFTLTSENAQGVAAICERLDGLPLAIELAAARVRVLPIGALLPLLDERLRLLSGGPQDRPARQRTLRAAIAWSYDLLTDAERAVFQRLGVFAGGFTFASATEVCATEGAVDPIALADALDALAAHSLIHPHGSDDATPRFSMFETIREFALDALHAASGASDARARHFAYALRLVSEAQPDLAETAPPATAAATRRRLERDHANLRAALDWATVCGDGEAALRLASAMRALWVPPGNLRTSRRWTDQSFGSLQEARSWLERALAASGEAPGATRAAALHTLGRVILFQAEDPTAERAAAAGILHAALGLLRASDDPAGAAQVLTDLGAIQFDDEDAAGASASYSEALHLARDHNLPVVAGWALIGLGRIAQASGDFAEAQVLLEDALAEHQRAGSATGTAAAFDAIGLLAQAQRDVVAARRAFEAAVAMRRPMGPQAGLPIALQRLAVLEGSTGAPHRAAELLAEVLELSQATGNPWDIANSLLSLGSLISGAGAPSRGARLLGAGEALIEARGLNVPAAYRSLYARSVLGVRRALGDTAFEAAFAEGAAMSLHDAVAQALAAARQAQQQPVAPT